MNVTSKTKPSKQSLQCVSVLVRVTEVQILLLYSGGGQHFLPAPLPHLSCKIYVSGSSYFLSNIFKTFGSRHNFSSPQNLTCGVRPGSEESGAPHQNATTQGHWGCGENTPPPHVQILLSQKITGCPLFFFTLSSRAGGLIGGACIW